MTAERLRYPARVSRRCSFDISFGLFGTHLERLDKNGSGVSVRAADGTTRPLADGCVIVRRRRCSGAVRASHHDVAVAALTATITKTPNTAISNSGVMAQYSTSTILRMISTPTTCRNAAVPIM